jgi:hypothetical protein
MRIQESANRLSRRDQESIGVDVVHASVHSRRKSCPSNAGLVEKAAGGSLHLARASKD